MAERHKGEEVKDYVDWKKVPKGYDWVAVEEMPMRWVHVFAYPVKPIARMGSMYESFQGGPDWEQVDDAIIGPLPQWRESLICRPKASE